MNHLKFFLFTIIASLMIYSCANDDDICENGLGTPRLKIKFKTEEGKITKPDSLYVGVKLDNTETIKTIAYGIAKPDSVLVPLRVDDSPYTEIYVSTRKTQIPSIIKLNYTLSSQYVSVACGLRRLYENTSAVLEQASAVSKVEMVQKNITDETHTHLYLIF
ncbi:DUF6452 family protein [Riemerella columbipharyngis]|uniref:Fimbrillin-A associated anchor protein Mfa1 and Mfa2 n=1 Tax=Riemerella columbipharyngis TaxID=1071918 RepID=A0A1G6Z9U8_9FLAO|nr:DUF6452 family protein [Riemerella columbipharyngis]SDD99063.1 hypothetical protein SAMN05421544_1026 [Riemerella columbipharyngis]